MQQWRALRAVLSCIGLLACSAEDDIGVNQQGATCEAGEIIPCACADGSQGTQSCAPTGDMFLACACNGAGAGGYQSAGGAPSAAGGYPVSGNGGTPVGTGGYTTGTGGLPVGGSGGYPVGTGGYPVGTGGVPVEGTGGIPVATGGTPNIGGKQPVIPQVTGECPRFADSTITFMGLGGIQIVAGSKPPSPTAPMVFYWHGTGSTAGEFAFMAAAVRQGVVSEGGVLVSFQGTTGGDLLSGTAIFGESDFNLTDQLVACAVRDHNIDPRRIFATGCSAGGLFSAAMAAKRSNYIAAAAPNSGGWVVPVAFQNDHTPALMTIHGAPGVDVVGVDFSNTSRTADQAFKGRGWFVINCNHGGRHCGASGLAGDIWNFFKAHPYGVEPKPWTGGLPPGFNASCQIF